MDIVERQQPLRIFCGYAHEDRALFEQLQKALAVLIRQKQIVVWHYGELLPGTEWKSEIEWQFNSADIILLLVSPGFIASDYCWSKEMQWAITRHSSGEVRVLPILLKPTSGWESTPLGNLQVLPTGAKPITNWDKRDDALADVVNGLQKVIRDIQSEESYDVRNRLTRHKLITLKERIPYGYLSISYMRDKAIIFRVNLYPSLQALLNDLYFTYLQGIYEPLTYGKDWVLASGDGNLSIWASRIAVPSTWLSPSHMYLPLTSYDPIWAASSLETYGLVAGSRWYIMGGLPRNTEDTSFIRLATTKDAFLRESYLLGRPENFEDTGFIGLATNNSDLAKDALLLAKDSRETSSHVLGFLLKNVFEHLYEYNTDFDSDQIALVPYIDARVREYQYLFVFKSLWWKQNSRTVLIYNGPWGDWGKVASLIQQVLFPNRNIPKNILTFFNDH